VCVCVCVCVCLCVCVCVCVCVCLCVCVSVRVCVYVSTYASVSEIFNRLVNFQRTRFERHIIRNIQMLDLSN